jgi:DnaJ-class molecular chaperone
MKDPYVTLGVARDASQEAIKNAYRSLAKKYHPDLNPGNKEREIKFKEIAAAYEMVGNAENRAKFDRGEMDEQRASAGPERPFYYQSQGNQGRYAGFSGIEEDFFENIFRAAGKGGRTRQPQDFPGEDQLYQMEVDFRDAALGAQREITLPGGKKLQIQIPAGIESGARLRFRGQGQPGYGKGPPGDAYVEINVRPLAGFTRRGREIEVELPISFYEAIAGGEVPVPTLDGSVALKIPPGVSTGSKLRIRGKGIGSKSGERGDQFVVLKVMTPKHPSAELQAAAREWEKKSPYDPRAER